jgi:hypothetical protein
MNRRKTMTMKIRNRVIASIIFGLLVIMVSKNYNTYKNHQDILASELKQNEEIRFSKLKDYKLIEIKNNLWYVEYNHDNIYNTFKLNNPESTIENNMSERYIKDILMMVTVLAVLDLENITNKKKESLEPLIFRDPKMHVDGFFIDLKNKI